VVLYDAGCGLCTCVMAVLLLCDRGCHLTPLALQAPRADILLSDLAQDDRGASWHLVSPTGVRYSAGTAVPVVLALLPLGRITASAAAVSPALTDAVYRWVADHRTRLSGLLPPSATLRARQFVADREVRPDPPRPEHRVPGVVGARR